MNGRGDKPPQRSLAADVCRAEGEAAPRERAGILDHHVRRVDSAADDLLDPAGERAVQRIDALESDGVGRSASGRVGR